MNRTLIKNLKEKRGEEVMVSGWIDTRRDQGKIIFLDIRDVSGKIQTVILPNHDEALEAAKDLRTEWVVKVTGKVNQRPEKNRNTDQDNGDIELEIFSLEILNSAETPVFDTGSDGKEIGDEVRLENRYLDLRRPRMQNNIRMRHKVAKLVRYILDQENFVEIETPYLTKSTPEGARDYIVPSRLYPGKFYALPQSPQQHKQLLMSAGFENYFQFARCMRDEDTRGDRQPEFTQLDLEKSFTTEEEIINLNEKIFIEIVSTLYPEKKIQQIPFPRITYKEALEKYGSDRPDIREDKNNPNLLAFVWVTDFPFFEKTNEGKWTFTHNPFSAPKLEHIENLKEKKEIENIQAAQYDIVLNGFEIGGGSMRNHKPELLSAVLEIIGHSSENIKKNFGHMLKALASGTPPHGGIAWGFDRFMMILQNESNIREVIAFPKTGEGKDLMMNAPSEVSENQLKDLNIKIKDESSG